MEKILVVYYSFEGNTKFVAEQIAKTLGADTLELRPKNEIKTKGFLKYVWGGSQILMKKRPELESFDKDPKDYDIIFIGTPVWAWNYAPPVGTFLDNTDLKGKKIALFSCHGGQNAKTFDKMKEALEKSTILGEHDFFEPLIKDKEENAKVAQQWATDIVKSLK